ncbi:MAG TPA: glycosyltransferase family 4 protein [Longimicrobium sp.]
MCEPDVVLYVDYSVGFGGAVKSLALTLRGLGDVHARIVTTQDAEQVDAWFGGRPVSGFRRWFNYRATQRVSQGVRSGGLRWAALKALAVADVAVTLGNAAWLAWTIRRGSVELVHLNNGFLPAEALLAARITGTPCVVHLRDFLHDSRAASSWAAGCVAGVIAVSDAVAESVRGAYAGRVVTVHDPVDLDAVERATVERERVRAACGLAPGEVAVGIFGRVIPWKGQLEFVRAAILSMRADPAIRAVVVGDESDGGPEYFERVRLAIRESGMEGRFVLAGYQREVEAWYAAMDVVVHASITPEPFGMVVPEAMAAGRAVIAADAGGPREVVTHGVDGLRVPPGDVEALADAIAWLSADADLRAGLGTRARQTARERFGIGPNAAAVRRVYAEVLGRGAERAGSVPAAVLP